MPTTLTPYLFVNAVTAAATYGPYRVDYRYDEERLRSISGTRVDVNDTVHVLVETVVPGADGTSVTVTATATSFTSANGTFNSCVLQGPFTQVKIQKVGASGAATFVGIL